MLLIAFLDFLSIDSVKDWMLNQGWWGGALISFALLLLCGVGLPLPEDIPLILSGALLCQAPPGQSVWQEWLIVGGLNWAGIIGGDICLYWIGRRYGRNITKIPLIKNHVTLDRIEKAKGWFDKYGVAVVAVGRLFAGVRGVMVVTAGTIRYNFLKFLIADGLAALVSGGIFMYVGHKVGENLDDRTIERFKLWFIAGGIALVVIVGIYILWRRSGHKSVTEAVAAKLEPREPEA